MKQTVQTSIILLILAMSLVAKPAMAISAPSFPSCLNPHGTVIASYAEGTHGIVGYSTAYSGADKVYQVSEGQVTQCFCGSDGSGIQTNWLNAADLSQDEIKSMEIAGWIYVPSGAPWGLTNDPYMAKNSNYSCLAKIDGSSSGTGGGSSSSSSSSSSTSNDIAGKVLGLAFTGSSEYIFNLWLYGLMATALGVWIKRYILRKKSSQ